MKNVVKIDSNIFGLKQEKYFLINHLLIGILCTHDIEYNDVCHINIKSYNSLISTNCYASGLVFFWDNACHNYGVIAPHMLRGKDINFNGNLKYCLEIFVEKTILFDFLVPESVYYLYFMNLCFNNCYTKFITDEILKNINFYDKKEVLINTFPQWFITHDNGLGVTQKFYMDFIKDIKQIQKYMEELLCQD